MNAAPENALAHFPNKHGDEETFPDINLSFLFVPFVDDLKWYIRSKNNPRCINHSVRQALDEFLTFQPRAPDSHAHEMQMPLALAALAAYGGDKFPRRRPWRVLYVRRLFARCLLAFRDPGVRLVLHSSDNAFTARGPYRRRAILVNCWVNRLIYRDRRVCIVSLPAPIRSETTSHCRALHAVGSR